MQVYVKLLCENKVQSDEKISSIVVWYAWGPLEIDEGLFLSP